MVNALPEYRLHPPWEGTNSPQQFHQEIFLSIYQNLSIPQLLVLEIYYSFQDTVVHPRD